VRVERILSYATAQARSSTLDGPSHWHRVASFGAQLCRATPGADLRVVSLFAVLHDAQRYTDGRDPEHGRRAAELALDLQGVLFKVTDERLNLLVEAIAKHADGLVTEDPTIACCWDADRLDLPRCGIQPNPALLSTPAARRRIGAA
jgi:uncharacterized protein